MLREVGPLGPKHVVKTLNNKNPIVVIDGFFLRLWNFTFSIYCIVIQLLHFEPMNEHN